MIRSCSLILPSALHARLYAHLFPGDRDEHGAVILAGMAQINGRTRLLARELYLAEEGQDHVRGQYGYKMIRADFIRPLIKRARQERLVYIGIHNHGDSNEVEFSPDDLASHERGHPALLDLAEGMPVGAAVFATNAVAGDIWFPDGERLSLDETRVIGANIRRLYSKPPKAHHPGANDEQYDRQLQMFGAAGQAHLRNAKVAVIGAGGVGSILVEYLSRLGVGSLVVIDPDRIDKTNLSRVVGASAQDLDGNQSGPAWRRWPLVRSLFPPKKSAMLKIDISKRMAEQANPDINFIGIAGDFSHEKIARNALDCDFIFLAADTMRARLVFNAIVQQYYIPGIQIGSLISSDSAGASLESVFSVTRWVTPGSSCLWCSDAIDGHRLAIEAKTDEERKNQAYGSDVANPSVITVNAVGASIAANDFLFSYLGLYSNNVIPAPRRVHHLDRRWADEHVRTKNSCTECSESNESRLGRGDAWRLPTFKEREKRDQSP